ncbi:serine/threonine protein kinase [Parafrankia discariae]|uniref:serine/threonine protein kinase n=1 Tax=Parafrankia discariae TaxID=365528 RepID=UPI000A04540C|nr:protein kinase [Parafrankia discariae]
MTTDDAERPTAGRPLVPSDAAHAERANGLHVGPPEAPDEYELFGEGTAGGEGVIWRARYRGALTSPVPRAIKLLNRPPGLHDEWPSQSDMRRWRDQIVLLNHLQLDHLVQVFELFRGAPPHPSGTAQARADVTYVAMEWVEGPTLDQLARGEPATRRLLAGRLEYVLHVAQTLAGLHSLSRSAGNPSLHRDVKPTNCIVHRERGVVLIDLSTMRLLADGYDRLGMVSHDYAAPEVLRYPHAPRAPSADLYSLGGLAVFCLLGENPPAASAATVPVLRQRIAVVGRQAGVPDPDAFAAHLVAMLSAEPERRPQDGVAWARSLIELAATAPTAPRRAIASRLAAALVPRRGRRLILGLGVVALGAFVALGPVGLWPDAQRGDRSGAVAVSGGPVTPVPGSSAPGADSVGRSSSDAAVTPTGMITSPGEDARVAQCSYFSGTAQIPSGSTLVLTMANLSNGQPEKYVEYVFGWDEPATTWSWRGAQYFGQPSDTSGQRYRVELMVIDLLSARQARAAGGDAVNALAASGTVLDDRTVVRVGGAVANNCEGP